MLAEVLVATAVLVAGGAAALHLTSLSLRALWVSGAETAAATLADQKLHQLRGLSWAADAAGAPISDLTSTLALDPPASGGTGLAPSPPGSLDANVAGFVDFLGADLGWLAGGVSPPSGTAFIRRWAILPLAADPDHTRVLQVLVIPAGGSVAGRAAGQRGPGEAFLTTVLTRTAR
jgi:hypothetical protein